MYRIFYEIKGEFDWVCFSPKKFKAPHPSIYEQADELKVVIYHSSDYQFAEKYAALVSEKCQKLLQPEWSKQNIHLKSIIEYVKLHPVWNISLQTHKFMDIP